MIDEIFELVEAPVDRAGFIPRFVEGVASPNWLPDALNAHAASGAPAGLDTDRRWERRPAALIHNQANTEMHARFKHQYATSISPITLFADARSAVLAVKGSLRRASMRALDGSGTLRRSLATSVIGSCAT